MIYITCKLMELAVYDGICLDYRNMDIRYEEELKSYHCNNCCSRNLCKRKEGCRHMTGTEYYGKGATSSGKCEAPCSYYEK